MRKEIWKPVAGTKYLVSNTGLVANRVFKRLIAQTTTESGYRRVMLWTNGRGTSHFVHRLVAAAFIGPLPSGKNVNHKNGVKTANNPENLEYTTPRENTAHAVAMGNYPHGERQGLAKLAEQSVRDIRANYVRGSGGVLARRYGVTVQAVHYALRGKTWKHI